MILWSFTAGTHGTAGYRLVREQCAVELAESVFPLSLIQADETIP